MTVIRSARHFRNTEPFLCCVNGLPRGGRHLPRPRFLQPGPRVEPCGNSGSRGLARPVQPVVPAG